MKTDCNQYGHTWVEENGEPYVRHRKRPPGKVAIMCIQCGTTTEGEAHGAFTTGGPGDSSPNPIPPSLKKVVDRAVEAARTAKPQTTEP